MFSVGSCSRCQQGLLGVRICCPDEIGLVVCDECEAIWLDAECTGPPLYPDSPGSLCPRCGQDLWQSASHWATAEEVDRLGWARFVQDAWDEPEE